MINFSEEEKKTLEYWKQKDIFKKSLLKTKKGKRFVFFEGPPTANGKPGIHHVLARAFKDLIPRYKTMQGFFVERKAGWDTQGLPVELEVEKEIGVSGKKDIEKYGIEKFCRKCKQNVWKYKKDWEQMTERLGFWIEMNDPYITYNNEYIETLWWIFKQIWDKELLYQGYKVVPHCPRCETALSSHEVAQGYRSVTETSMYVKFKLVDEPDTYVLAWTTTPWTLPGNVALALGPKIKYVKVKIKDEYYILAKDTLKVLEGKYEIVKEYTPKELEGKKYKPLFDFLDIEKITGQPAYYLALADFVSVEEGTGVVHTAVMYGEDDYDLGEKIGLPKYHTVNPDGKFIPEVKPWAGRFVKDVDKEIIQYLDEHNLLYKTEATTHDYPFCWRCDTPLLYYAKNSWFIKMSALREKLIANNKKINWVPEYIKEGRFGEWLNEVKDWAVSRERYWGTPIPIWICEKCGEKECIGDFSELFKKSAKELTEAEKKQFDPHRPKIDEIKLKCKCGGEMKRIPDVADTWFDSGSMPYAQWGYPNLKGSKKKFLENYPADYICEAMDQTRGWFYTLLAISTLLENAGQVKDGACYKNVICLGLILDKKGQKMSKSKGNVVLPEDVFSKFGADATRFYLYTVSQPGETKNFDFSGIEEVVKKVLLILMNVLSFYKLYAHTEKIKIVEPKFAQLKTLDQWILAELNHLILKTTEYLDNYKITEAGRLISTFINHLSTWYLRRSRDRFKGNDENDKKIALQTLGYVLFELSRLMSPFTPFTAEKIYQEIGGEKESVHLEDWAKFEKLSEPEIKIREMMDLAREIVEAGHSLRADNGIKVRQPLSQVVFYSEMALDDNLQKIVLDELNVKEVHLVGKEKKPSGKEFVLKEGNKFWVALDTTITDELKEQGWVREVIRQINSLRKEAGLTIKDKIRISVEGSFGKKFFERYQKEILDNTLAEKVEYKKVEEMEHKKDLVLDKEKIKLGIEKI